MPPLRSLSLFSVAAKQRLATQTSSHLVKCAFQSPCAAAIRDGPTGLSQKRFASVQQPPGPNLPGPPDDPNEDDSQKSRGSDEGSWRSTAHKMAESALTTAASVAILGMVGYGYTRYYKYMVLEKMEGAFRPGDPVLDLAAAKKQGSATGFAYLDAEDRDRDHWVLREEQGLIDDIVHGRLKGQYHLLVGEKGTGKSSMLIDAMAKIDGEGVAMFEAHADPEIFRIRLGKALDFEFHEDNIGSLFSIRGPRDASALLDIERAFNKMEKIALRRREAVGRPLILIVNSMHLLRGNEQGQDLLELLQQRSEQWAASNLVTVVFNSDEDRKSTRLNSSHSGESRMPSSA